MKRESAIKEGRDIHLLWGLYDQINATIEWIGMDKGIEQDRDGIEESLGSYSQGHSPVVEVHGSRYDISNGQDPEIITIKFTDHELAAYVGDRFGSVGVNFEVSQYHKDGPTKLTLGSGDYAWRHRNERNHHAFTRSGTSLIIAEDMDHLLKNFESLFTNKAFRDYLNDPENTVMGAVKGANKLLLYDIK